MARFSPDAETASRKDDRLGRYDFAARLARAVAEWESPHSLTLALYGNYGTGKSSVKRMTVEALAEEWALTLTEARDHTLDIAPWSWVHTDDWILAFFRELGQTVGAQIADPDEKRRVARLFDGLGARVGGAGTALKALGELVAVLGEEATGLGTASRIFGSIRALFQSKSEVAEAEADAGETKSLEGTKAEIAHILAARDRPLVVFVDEIDRLTDDEIRTLFRVVRANADFPNLVFVLLFQRSVVEAALEGEGASGREYLEKIVQVGLDLPEPPRGTLPDLFADDLTSAAGDVAALDVDARTSLRSKLHEWLDSTLYAYVQTPRDIIRLANTYRFYLGGFVEDGILSVDPLDLLLLEVLRTHEAEVYRQLPRIKEDLVGEYPMEFMGTVAERRSRVVSELIADASDEPATRDVLVALFPITGAVLHDDKLALSALRQNGGDWARSRRVAHPDMFDRYFAFTEGEEPTLQERVEALVADHADRDLVASRLVDLARRGELEEGIRRVLSFADEIAAGDPVTFLAGYLELGEPLGGEGMSQISPGLDSNNALTVVRTVLAAVRKSSGAVEPTLLRALQMSRGLVFPVRIAQKAAEDPEKFGISAALTPKLDQVARSALKKGAQDGLLINSPRLRYLLERWRHLARPDIEGASDGSEDDATRWVRERRSDPNGLVRLLRAYSVPDVENSESPYEFGWERLEWWIDLDTVSRTLTEQVDEVQPADRELVDTFLRDRPRPFMGEEVSGAEAQAPSSNADVETSSRE